MRRATDRGWNGSDRARRESRGRLGDLGRIAIALHRPGHGKTRTYAPHAIFGELVSPCVHSSQFAETHVHAVAVWYDGVGSARRPRDFQATSTPSSLAVPLRDRRGDAGRAEVWKARPIRCQSARRGHRTHAVPGLRARTVRTNTRNYNCRRDRPRALVGVRTTANYFDGWECRRKGPDLHRDEDSAGPRAGRGA